MWPNKVSNAKTVSANVLVSSYICMYVVHKCSLVSVSTCSINANTLPNRKRKRVNTSACFVILGHSHIGNTGSFPSHRVH